MNVINDPRRVSALKTQLNQLQDEYKKDKKFNKFMEQGLKPNWFAKRGFSGESYFEDNALTAKELKELRSQLQELNARNTPKGFIIGANHNVPVKDALTVVEEMLKDIDAFYP